MYIEIDKKINNFLQKVDFNKKVENYKLKKLQNKFKTIYKSGHTNYKV